MLVQTGKVFGARQKKAEREEKNGKKRQERMIFTGWGFKMTFFCNKYACNKLKDFQPITKVSA